MATDYPTADGYWRIVPDPAATFGAAPVDGHLGAETTATAGESYTFGVLLTADSDSAAGAWPGYVERYKQLLQYAPRAGQYAAHEPMGGGMRYTPTHDDRVPGDSLLVAIRPPHDSETGRGGWYLIDSIEDQTTLASSLCQLSIDMTLVAPLADYQDHVGARDALENRGIRT